MGVRPAALPREVTENDRSHACDHHIAPSCARCALHRLFAAFARSGSDAGADLGADPNAGTAGRGVFRAGK